MNNHIIICYNMRTKFIQYFTGNLDKTEWNHEIKNAKQISSENTIEYIKKFIELSRMWFYRDKQYREFFFIKEKINIKLTDKERLEKRKKILEKQREKIMTRYKLTFKRS